MSEYGEVPAAVAAGDDVTVTEYAVTGLVPHTTYIFHVVAENSLGRSPEPSNAVIAVTRQSC